MNIFAKKRGGARGRLMGSVLALGTYIGPAYAAYEDYTPVPLSSYDFSKNPGCGSKGFSRDQKIKRNLALAEMFFQSYLDGRERGIKKRGWHDHNCFAKDATILIGLYNPPPSKPMSLAQLLGPLMGPDGKMPEEDVEFKRWRNTFPNFGVVPGSFRVLAVDENSISWVNSFGGPDGDLIATDGEHSPPIWEVEVLRVNDLGQITHYDSWTDPLATDRAFRKMFGKSYVEKGDEYFKQLHKDYKEGDAGAAKPLSIDSPIGDIIANPAGKAILAKYWGEEAVNGPTIEMARGMSLRTVATFPQSNLSQETLKAIDNDLAKLPAAPAE